MTAERLLGRDGPTVSALGLGCLGMSDYYGGRDEEESLATLRLALELGVTLFDTADVYGAGSNEELVGKGLHGWRGRVVLATKFGLLPSSAGGFGGVDGSPEYVRRACEASLRRLGVDCIDLYYLHRVDPRVPIEETVGAMAGLVRDGKVRWIGLCETGPETIRRAQAVHPIAAVQVEYSLWTRQPAEMILAVCRELGIGLVPYSPLGRGFLSGALTDVRDIPDDDYRRTNPRFQAENFERNRRLVELLEEIARANGCTAAQLALAWLLAQGEEIVPIPGTKRRRYLRENCAAAEVRLSADELAAIEAALARHAVAGARYSEGSMRLIEPGAP
ncbi:MAG: aldo/keto reductase [bacterium]|nr:aldo/keto reductase [bacterium]